MQMRARRSAAAAVALVLALSSVLAVREARGARAPGIIRRVADDDADNDERRPALVRLAFAGSDRAEQPTGMTVSWTTSRSGPPLKSVVLIGVAPGNLTHRVESTSPLSQQRYLPGGSTHHHVAVLELEPSTTYYYRCGDDATFADGSGLSEETSFRTAPDVTKAGRGGEGGFTVGVWGDMGAGNCSVETRAMLRKFDDQIDFVWHLGDIAYQDDYLFLDFAYERVLDEYMDSMSFLSQTRPYMVLPGNHEVDCHAIVCILDKTYRESLHNFTAYNARWRMPSEESGGIMNMWYSYNHGPAHFVSLDSETDFPDAYENEHDEFFLLDSRHFNPTPNAYLEWLERDLKRAASPEQRKLRPWIIVGSHRPMYIFKDAFILREAVEDLLVKYEVDLFVSGHVHSYYRTFPVANNGTFSPGYLPQQRKGKIVNIVVGGPGAIDRPMAAAGARGSGWGARGAWDWLKRAALRGLYEGLLPLVLGRGRGPEAKADPVNIKGAGEGGLVAHHTDEMSFGLLHVVNETLLRWDLVSSKTGETIDTVELRK